VLTAFLHPDDECGGYRLLAITGLGVLTAGLACLVTWWGLKRNFPGGAVRRHHRLRDSVARFTVAEAASVPKPRFRALIAATDRRVHPRPVQILNAME
jgi:hypothetical protein